MAETEVTKKTYRGNCHCGGFIYEIEIPEIKDVLECNCSICVKKSLVSLLPGVDLNVIKNEGLLTEYSFGKKDLVHYFCSKCGNSVYGTSEKYPPPLNLGVNARCIQDLDIWNLEIKHYDGRKGDPQYVPLPYTGPDPTPAGIPDGEGKTYHGSCHCGAVTVAVKTKYPVEDDAYTEPVLECDCSSCFRGGETWINPLKDEFLVQGRENIVSYSFGHKAWRDNFCKICGVYIYKDLNDDQTEEEIAAMSEQSLAFREKYKEHRPFNLRVLDNFDLESVRKNKVRRVNGSEQTPAYVNP